MKPIQLFVVDDDALFRTGLVGLLDERADFEVVGQAADGKGAIVAIQQLKPDVVLLNVNIAGMSSVQVVEELKRDEKCRILLLTISEHEGNLFGAVKAGADGYLLRNVGAEELCHAIWRVHEGNPVLSPGGTRAVRQAAANAAPPTLSEWGLSRRELEVLEHLAEGQTTGQIAEALYVSDNTVKTHIRHILGKMGASNRIEAICKAIQCGLIQR